MKEERTYFVGIDLHKEYSTVTVLDEAGSEIDQRNLANDPENFTLLFSKDGIAFLKSLEPPEQTQRSLEGLLRTLEFLQGEFRPIRNRIIASAKENEEAKLLESIPGFGYFSSLLFLKEIGTMERFASPKKLVSYSGLAPGISVNRGNSNLTLFLLLSISLCYFSLFHPISLFHGTPFKWESFYRDLAWKGGFFLFISASREL